MRLNQYGQMIGEDLSGWQPRDLPQKNILQGGYCRLEPIDPARHAKDLYAAHNSPDDPMLWTYLLQEKPASEDEMLAMLKEFAATGDPMHFAVVDLPGKQAVGSLALMRIDPANGVIEIGHINFSPRLRRTTQATEAIYLLLKYVFNGLGYRRCEWKCDNFNQPSKRAALRFGFSFEGVFQQAVVTKARSRDTAWYAIIDKQWPGLEQGFSRWLEKNNFSANGQQKSALVFDQLG